MNPNSQFNQSAIISIAPMLDWTDRYYRRFMRKISYHSTLYTEMIVADAIIHGDHRRLLSFNQEEYPLVIQLGGSDPIKLAAAAKICAAYGYGEINLNIGCPSPKVQSGNFGAALMDNPQLVADCFNQIQNLLPNIPVTIKHRTGLNYQYNYDFLSIFVGKLAAAGCKTFIIHARNAILNGLSPKENRDIPPLRYDFVYKLKQDFPKLKIIINGGIKTTLDIDQHLTKVDGVMIGREAYHNPFLFAEFDRLYYNDSYKTAANRQQIAVAMIEYLAELNNHQIRLHQLTRHMHGLYYNTKYAKLWRRALSAISQQNDLAGYKNLINQLD